MSVCMEGWGHFEDCPFGDHWSDGHTDCFIMGMEYPNCEHVYCPWADALKSIIQNPNQALITVELGTCFDCGNACPSFIEDMAPTCNEWQPIEYLAPRPVAEGRSLCWTCARVGGCRAESGEYDTDSDGYIFQCMVFKPPA